MSKAGGEAAADSDKKYTVGIIELYCAVFNLNVCRFYLIPARKRC
jgi:hypothetical protein